MKRLSDKGFTLIELLTVIAIIMILAGMVFIVGPRMIERAKITSWVQVCNEIRTTAVAYMTKKAVGVSSYPPAYGYLIKQIEDADLSQIGTGKDELYFCMAPYVSQKYLGYMRNYDVYDPFARTSHDTDRDGAISLLEFSLTGEKQATSDSYVFSDEAQHYVYNGNNLSSEVQVQLTSQRPMLYIPVNLAQAKLVAQYYARIIQDNGELLAGANATRWNTTETFPNDPDEKCRDNPLRKLHFPPNCYDDFILISVGPTADTGGIVTPLRSENGGLVDYTAEFLAGVYRRSDWYHVLALRAYYLATRDINDNGMLDFDFRNRTRSGEGKPTSYSNKDLCLLPNGTNGAGPLIYVPNKAIAK